jgi:hypothetical protein
MTQSPYAALLAIVRRQVDLATHGEVHSAVALMPRRADVLANNPAPADADHDVIREILGLDRELATVIRQRMIELRNEAVNLQQGRHALAGYRPPSGERRPRRLNAFS